jgi:serine/threonine protein kinase
VKALDGGNVHLAMSFLPGVALDQWLYGISESECKHVGVAQLVEGKLSGGRQSSVRLNRACKFTQDFLLQLAPVLAALQPLAYHRDVSSHNVLIDIVEPARDGPTNSEFSVALIDFGLAVRSETWHREWCTSDLAGDPRYWTPAAFMSAAFGFKYMESQRNRSFLHQYLHRIDHYAIGVLSLEVLFSLWNKEEKYIFPSMAKLYDAWCAFWRSAIRLHQFVHSSKDPESLRRFLAHSPEGGIDAMIAQCKCLRDALRAAAAVSANSSHTVLFSVLADLISENGHLTWKRVSSILNGGLEAQEWLTGLAERMASCQYKTPMRS